MNTAKAPTFEGILVDALTHTISSDALYDLVQETKAAITVAENDAAIAKAAALDPLQSPDADAARATMEAARFKADRLRALLPRLQERLVDVGNHEEYLQWREKFDPLKVKVNEAAAKLKAVYQKVTAELVPLLTEIEKLDFEVARTLAAKPHHARQSNNDGCFLRPVELTARGLKDFSIYANQIMQMKLPDLNDQDRLLWPPNRQLDYSHTVPVFKHPGADWWKPQAQEHAEKAAIAERLNAEQQQAEALKRETRHHHPSDSVTY